ncbi:hypothetical protein ACN47E_004414 [Coniothyrium glycines]
MDTIDHGSPISEDEYSDYFYDILEAIVNYQIQTHNIYNMCEKAFTANLNADAAQNDKKLLWDYDEICEALEDKSREFVGLLACICADGSQIPPSLVYPSLYRELYLDWLKDMDPKKHTINVTVSHLGWSDAAVRHGWMKEVFNRYTQEKADGGYRLLIIDDFSEFRGHEFREFCEENKIRVCRLPPDSRKTLQPLDLGLTVWLEKGYRAQVLAFLRQRVDGLSVPKSDFFSLFSAAWEKAITEPAIMTAFEIAGLPLSRDAVLGRLSRDEASKIILAAPPLVTRSGRKVRVPDRSL